MQLKPIIIGKRKKENFWNCIKTLIIAIVFKRQIRIRSIRKQKMSKTFFYYSLGYGFAFFLALFKVPFLTNFFTPSELGAYTIINSVLAYIDVIFFSWINGTIWRNLYDKKFQTYSSLLNGILPILSLAFL